MSKKWDGRTLTAEDAVALAATLPGTPLVIGRAVDYPHAAVDTDGTMADRWLDRRRRAVATVAARSGVTGSTSIVKRKALFTVAEVASPS